MTAVPTTLNRTCTFTGLKALGLAVLFCAAMQPAFAQSESSWSNQGLIYLLGPTLDGTSGIGPIDTDVDMSASLPEQVPKHNCKRSVRPLMSRANIGRL